MSVVFPPRTVLLHRKTVDQAMVIINRMMAKDHTLQQLKATQRFQKPHVLRERAEVATPLSIYQYIFLFLFLTHTHTHTLSLSLSLSLSIYLSIYIYIYIFHFLLSALSFSCPSSRLIVSMYLFNDLRFSFPLKSLPA